MQDIVLRREAIPVTTCHLYGNMLNFYKGDGLFLSSSDAFFNQNFFDFYSDTRSTSAFYPPFSGTPVEEYTVLEDGTKIEFKLPNNLSVGFYDVIFCNEAGYSKLSEKKGRIKIIL